MKPKRQLTSSLLPETIVKRDYIVKKPIYINLGAPGIYEISLLDFSPDAETFEHPHKDDHELTVSLSSAVVDICAKGEKHNTHNKSSDYNTYLSVKSRTPFDTYNTYHILFGSKEMHLNALLIPEELVEGDYAVKRTVYFNPGSMGVTDIFLVDIAPKTILHIPEDAEEFTLIVNTQNYIVTTVNKNESQIIINNRKKFATYLVIKCRTPFDDNLFKENNPVVFY